MRNISPELELHLSSEVTSLACCFLLTLKDQTILGFTDYIENLLIEDVTYLANSGFNKSAIESNSNFAVDNLELECLIDHQNITEESIIAGIYDMAKIEIFLVNYLDPNMGKIMLKSGYMGQISLYNGKFTAEIKGISHKLMANATEIYSAGCRASLGDGFCKLKLIPIIGEVTKVISNNSWIDNSLTQENSYFNYGKVRFVTGKNALKEVEVKEFNNKEIVTILSLPYNIEIGDEYEITVGCDKKFSSCVGKFNNAVNFRGEPHIYSL